jgi:transcription elongation GreA/GreB family factor
MSIRLIVTRQSLQFMAEKMELHQSQKIAAQKEAKVAKEWGDLSENAEYKASKEKFRLAGRLQQRMVRDLKKLENSGYEIVDPLDWTLARPPINEVTVGTVAKVTQNGHTEDCLIVGAKDQHLPMEGKIVPVPYTSPLGQALLGAAANSRVQAIIAGEMRTLEVGHLRAPHVEELYHFYPDLEHGS